MKIVSVTDMRTRLELPDETATNTVLEQMIEGFSAMATAAINRKLKKATYKQKFKWQDRVLMLEAPPVESITHVRWQKASSEADEHEDVDSDDYFLDADDGEITLSKDVCAEDDSILLVEYVGGFPETNGVLDFTADPELGAALKQAVIDQISITYQRRDSLDASSVSAGGFSEAIRVNGRAPSWKMLREDFYHY